ncbi:uncharacterized protein N7503_008253 [Penicillium pulvis]|uniref:uncharacterized protein n=1 Tax=Penicillium pulvis TaxID=1562058 RepID=UPI0025466898|nr:uncharacterized protein N7503_008253 [Penicillium pulvis]KAJ5792275.1 hypothetical protein N7503_008253 [Penicillium pulvis]
MADLQSAILRDSRKPARSRRFPDPDPWLISALHTSTLRLDPLNRLPRLLVPVDAICMFTILHTCSRPLVARLTGAARAK